MDRRLLLISAVLGFSAVAFGAFGAHGLKSALADAPDAAQRLAWWDTGARYHLIHALALGLTSVLAAHVSGRVPRLAAAAFVAGIALFAGSLYVMAATGLRALGAVTPLGGAALLTGWALLALGATRLR